MTKNLPFILVCALAFTGSYLGVSEAITAPAPTLRGEAQPTITVSEQVIEAEPTPAPPLTLAEVTVVGQRPARKAITIRHAVAEPRPTVCTTRELAQGSGSVKVCEAAQ